MASDRVDRYRGRDYDTDRSPSPRERRYSRTTEANPREHEYDRHRRPSHSYPDDSAHPKRLDAEYSDGHARHRRRSSSKRDHYDDDESEDDERDRKRRRSRSEHGKRDKKDRDRDREKGREKDKGPGKHRDKPRDRDPDRATPSDDEELLELEMLGVKEITEDDYFVRSSEFKFWLSDSRGKDLHDMSSDSSRKYFRKFVRRWNDGALRERYYHPQGSAPPGSSAHKWSFTSHGSSRPVIPRDTTTPSQTHSARRQSITSTSKRLSTSVHSPSPSPSESPEPGPLPPPSLTTTSSKIGPSRPGATDRQLAAETAKEAAIAQAKAERRASRKSAYEKAEELAPRAVGKEGKMAEKKATNAVNKEMRDKDVGGLEVDEGTLMGSEGGSYAAALRARDTAAARKQEKRDLIMADRRAADEERLADRRKKDSDTMEMLREMARQRYG